MEIRDWMESENARARGPFAAESVGAADYLIMRASDLEPSNDIPGKAEVDSVHRGMDCFAHGDVIDARELPSKLRNRYGL